MKHIKNIVNIFRSKRGSSMVSASVVMLILSGVLALMLTVAPVLDSIATTDRIANEVARYIEVRGDTANAHSELERLKTKYKILELDMQIDANTIGNTSRIQLDDEFTVIIERPSSIGIGPLIKRSFPITRKATGRSEHYWKN